ncbi:MAG: carboxypeptidase regulatory-like domain-containing protein [Deltaproteobacteria bacterium]|nr:carboxypeptidase regulatory-like domain-containing protein [Deltaproteobacteria bacterium]
MARNRFEVFLLFAAVAALFATGCSGEVGDVGTAGPQGPAGNDGVAGAAGKDGTNGTNGTNGVDGAPGAAGTNGTNGTDGADGKAAVDTGTISGFVKDGAGTGLEGVAVSTTPATTTAQTDATGAYTLSVPIGFYTVNAALTDYNDAAIAGVGVAAGATTTANLTLMLADAALVSVAGKVTDTAGVAVEGATVQIAGTSLQAVTDATGAYTIASVPSPGPYFVEVTPPAGDKYLGADSREALWAVFESNPADDIMLSARPSNAATYVGRGVCQGCHTTIGASHQGSAHWRSLTQDLTRFRYPNLWPTTLMTTVDTGITALDPTTCSGSVTVLACQNAAGAYSMKFGGTANCAVADGTVIPISGTYGGEGDGGADNQNNVGRYKQRFFAKLADVPFASSWTYTSGKDKDYLILPVQVTESGSGAAKFGAYKNTEWCVQARTFSRACSACHNTGETLTYTQDAAAVTTAYNYIDFNVSCEKCHGPASEHTAAGGGKAKGIINPAHLTANMERQVCGQCHAADAGKSKEVVTGQTTKFSFAYNPAHAAEVGGGYYVPGVYDIGDFISNLTSGGFDAWPDGKHGKAHRQQYSELSASIHANNPYERLTCSSCHDVHTLKQGPASQEVNDGVDDWEFVAPKLSNNNVCLACHAGYGPFADLTKDDIGALHAGSATPAPAVKKNGTDQTFTAEQIASAKAVVAGVVVDHMNATANMGYALVYDPDNEPGVGRCQTCHMPNTGKSGGYSTGVDQFGKTALVEGDEASHRFDIIAPQVSKALVKTTGGADTDVMPNSCGKCHARYRYSGDAN